MDKAIAVSINEVKRNAFFKGLMIGIMFMTIDGIQIMRALVETAVSKFI